MKKAIKLLLPIEYVINCIGTLKNSMDFSKSVKILLSKIKLKQLMSIREKKSRISKLPSESEVSID